MTAGRWDMDWTTLFLAWRGRIGRREFWIGFLIVMLASVLFGSLPVIGQIAGLLLLWPQFCIHAKRLHDFGRSAWLMLVPVIVSLVALVLAGVSMFTEIADEGGVGPIDPTDLGQLMLLFGPALGFLGLALLVGLAFLLWVGLTPGDPRPNRFGPPPVGR